MPDRRTVDELTIEELEYILRLKRREARMDRLKRYELTGRRVGDAPLPDEPEPRVRRLTSEDKLSFQSYMHENPRRKNIRDRLLLVVEVLSALGLIAVLVFAALSLQDINRESAEAQAEQLASLPTAAPTPLITAVVLPGGHTPPTSPGGAQPNYDEVPAHLRPRVEQQFAGPVIVPTPSIDTAIRIEIPALSIDAPIVQGDGWEQLKKGVGQHLGMSSIPGTSGNVVLSAHNDIYGQIFRYLDQLQRGDEITIHTQTRRYTYRVEGWRVVEPTEVSVMAPTESPIVTLISCYPYLDNSKRIVVVGELVE